MKRRKSRLSLLTLILDDLFSLDSLVFALRSMVIIFACIFLLITIYDLKSNDDAISNEPILKNEDVTFQIRTKEARYRDQILKHIDSIYLDKQISLIDSISKSSIGNNEIKKLIIINKLKTDISKSSFSIKPQKSSTSFLIELKQLRVIFEIDFTKLTDILNSSSSYFSEDNIKYGNYLKTSYGYEKKLRIDYLVITIFSIIALLVLSHFLRKIGLKNKKEGLEEFSDKLTQDREYLNEAKKILEDNSVSHEEIQHLKALILGIETNLANYNFDKIIDSILYKDLQKSEKKALELYSRSTLMLILGLLVAVAGIFVFYFTLPDFSDIKNATEYIALTIRPAIILIFIQSISFYLLRQYRSLINDYKYFNNEYLKKSKIFIAHQLMQNENINENEIKLINSLLSKEPVELKEDAAINMPNDRVMEILKVVLEKLK